MNEQHLTSLVTVAMSIQLIIIFIWVIKIQEKKRADDDDMIKGDRGPAVYE